MNDSAQEIPADTCGDQAEQLYRQLHAISMQHVAELLSPLLDRLRTVMRDSDAESDEADYRLRAYFQGKSTGLKLGIDELEDFLKRVKDSSDV